MTKIRATEGQTCKGTKKDDNPCNSKDTRFKGYCSEHRDQAPATCAEQVQAWWRKVQLRWRWVGVLTLLATLFFAAAEICSNVFGLSVADLVTSWIPTPAPTPFTTPAAEGEYLIIVAEFQDNSAARNLNVRSVLAEAINDALPDDLNARVVAAHGIVPEDEDKARAIGKDHHATIILWGQYHDNRIEVSFTPLVPLDTPTQMQEQFTITQTVDELAIFVNDLAAGPVRWLSLLTIGQTLYLAGSFDEARAQFDAALALLETMEPDARQLAATYLYRADTYLFQGRYELAIEDYGRAIELNPEYAIAYNHRATARFAQEDLTGAVADLDRAIELNPEYTEAYYNRGNLRRAQRDLEGAIEDYDRAIELRPEYASAYSNRGIARFAQEDLEGAIEDYDRAIELNPERAVAYFNRGIARTALGDLERAIEDYDRAIELDPEYAFAYNNRGITRTAQGDLVGAIEDYDRAIELKLIGAYTNRAAARAALGDLEGAIEDCDRAIELNPEFADAYSNRGNARTAQGDLEGAIEDYDRAIELDPAGADAYNGRGAARYLQGDLEGAIEDYDRAIELNPGYTEAYYNRGNLRKAQGDLARAVADFEQALAILEATEDPRAEQVRRLLAELDD